MSTSAVMLMNAQTIKSLVVDYAVVLLQSGHAHAATAEHELSMEAELANCNTVWTSGGLFYDKWHLCMTTWLYFSDLALVPLIKPLPP